MLSVFVYTRLKAATLSKIIHGHTHKLLYPQGISLVINKI